MKIIAKVPIWMLLCLFSLSHATETSCSAALPSISKTFNVSGNFTQLSSSVYFVGFALGIFSLGRVSDIFGRRPVILGGLTFYLVSSVISIFAFNIEMLTVLRFCQAYGASVGSVIGQAMARDSYEGRELSYVYASISMGLALIPSISSALAGYIIEYSGWRYIFMSLSTISGILLFLYFKYLPETNPFIGIARKNKYFTILKVVIKDRIVLLYAFIIGAFNGMGFGFYIEAPFIFIERLGMTPSNYGRLAFLLGLANASGSLLSKYLVKKHIDNKKLMASGLILSLIGCTLLVLASCLLESRLNNKYLAITSIFGPMMIQLIGHSLLIPMSLRYALEDYSKVTGTAGSIFGSVYYLLVALISFIVAKIHGGSIIKFTLLFLGLSIACSLSFYLIQKWHPTKKKIEFI